MLALWDRLRNFPEAAGALFGLALVAFGIVAAFLIRDLMVASRQCVGGDVAIVICQLQAGRAQARLPWEVIGLLIIGGAIGAARALRR